MRVNVHAEELTDRIEIIEKKIYGRNYTGLRIYLPVTWTEYAGPCTRGPADDVDSSVTFWGDGLRAVLLAALARLDGAERPRHRQRGAKRGKKL